MVAFDEGVKDPVFLWEYRPINLQLEVSNIISVGNNIDMTREIHLSGFEPDLTNFEIWPPVLADIFFYAYYYYNLSHRAILRNCKLLGLQRNTLV